MLVWVMNRRHQPRSARAAALPFHPALSATRSRMKLTACGVYPDLSGPSHHHRMKAWAFGIFPSPLYWLPNSQNPTSPPLSVWNLCDLRAKSKSSAKELPFVFMRFRTLYEKHGGVYQLFPKWNASARTRWRSRQQLTVCGVYRENWLEELMRRRLPILATLLVL